MKNKKGFTLIELLAVIVILAIIALVATPIILNMINNARKSAAISTAYGYVNSVEYSIGLSDIGSTEYENIDIKNQEYDINDEALLGIKLKGKKPDSGTIVIENRKIKSGSFCINKYKVIYDGREAKIINTNECKKSNSEENQNVVIEDKQPCELEIETKNNKEVYYIDSEEDLYAFSASVNNGNNYSGKIIELRNSLDFSNYTSEKKSNVCETDDNKGGFIPIGTSTNPFKGTFEGNAKIISNLQIDKSSNDSVGLFGYVLEGNIKGVILTNSRVEGNNNVGAIVGTLSSSTARDLLVDNINVQGQSYIGLAIGREEGTGNNPTNTDNILIKSGVVNANSYVGGAIGYTAYNSSNTKLIVEDATITANSYAQPVLGFKGLAADGEYTYYSKKVKINDTEQTSGFNESDINDINFYETGRLDTWIGGDNDDSNYYFDYDSGGKITLKSINQNPIPSNIDDVLEKSGDSYLIKTVSDWKNATVFANKNKTFKLANNLDFNNKKYYIMGSEQNTFKGIFKGDANTIKNVKINASSVNSIGLFGYTTEATIEGLMVNNIEIKGNNNVGAIVGTLSSSTARYLLVDGTNIQGQSYIGTAIGREEGTGTIPTSTNNILIKNGIVNGNSYVGGTIGYTSYYSSNNNIIVENATITANSYAQPVLGFKGLAADGAYTYYSEKVKINDTEQISGFDEVNINNLEYYSGKINTSTANTEYYFNSVIDKNGVFLIKNNQ